MKTMQDYGAAIEAYQSALQAYSSGSCAQSEALLKSLLIGQPGFAEAHHLLGICHYVRGNLAEAEDSIRTALSIAKHEDFYVNLGLVLQQAGDAEEAAKAYKAALQLNARLPKAYNNLANILMSQNRLQEAVGLYRQAVSLQPNYPIGHKNLGACLLRLKRFVEAEAAFRHAIALDDSFTESKFMLGDLLVQTERFEEAFEIYRAVGAWGRLQFEMRTIASWNDLVRIDEACLDQVRARRDPLCGPGRLLQMPGLTIADQRQVAHDFAVKEFAGLNAPRMCNSDQHPAPGRRLRIGYLSSDFFDHATMHLLAGVLETHDLSAFDINIFSYSPKRDDAFAARLRSAALPIIDISEASDQAAAREIHGRKIDILVDLKGYATSAQLGISALRPAPIIVSWLGYPGTLGHERLADYIIGDAIVTPPEEAEYYSERLALMPNSYQPNDRLRPLPTPPSRHEAGLPETGVIFCSFNQSIKFNPQTFDIWGRLLSAIPDSALWLLQPKQPIAASNIKREFSARGISENRIIFAPFAEQADHLARLQLADIALDTYPYNSHTTASDVLWAGVPLVTLKGETFASRVAASLLTAHGFPELIADSEDGYFDIARDLALNSQERANLRSRLRRSRHTSPLFDTQRFTRDLEALFRAIASDHSQPSSDPIVVQYPEADADQRAAYYLALDAYRSGDWSKASDILRELVADRPQFANAHHLLGVCHLLQNNVPAAEASIRTALKFSDRADFHANLALILLQTNRLAAAADSYRASLRMEPDSIESCNNLANILSTLRQYEEALEFFRHSVRLQPESAHTHQNLGGCLFKLGHYSEAEAALQNAIALDGSSSDAKSRLADLFMHTEQFDKAFKLYGSMGAWGWLQFGMRSNVSWNGLGAVDALYLEELKAGKAKPASPWCLIHMDGLTPDLERRAAFEYSQQNFKELRAPPICTRSISTTSDRRLRLGYLSSDFYNHATMHLIAGVLESHNLADFEVFILSYGPKREDDYTQRLRAIGLPFADISAMSAEEAAHLINRLDIDILVDLKGHTGTARTRISALRPAPIIANWLGHPGTLGHERLADYIIGDAIVTPPDDAAFYSERLALMPYTYQPNDRLRPLPKRLRRSQANLPDSGIVFCSFNQPAKFNPETFDVWGCLLRAVPDSALWLLAPPAETTQHNIVEQLAARNIPTHRIIFAPTVSQADHIARLQLADIALDTFPYNSHTTASDALWAGVPLVTRKGMTFASKVAASLLDAHGFPELITNNVSDYFDLALDIATNHQRRAELSERLDRARTTSPLFDTELFTQNLERLYRAMAENHAKPEELRAPVIGLD